MAIALLIGVNIYNLVWLAELDNRLPYLEGLSHDISNVGWSVTELSEYLNEMREQFIQEQAWVQESGYEIQNIDTAENTMDQHDNQKKHIPVVRSHLGCVKNFIHIKTT